MYPGWLALGEQDPVMSGAFIEIVNNARAYAYAANFGICWLKNCNDCPDIGTVIPGGPTWVSPEADGAPWYDPDNPDTAAFYGVIGLEVSGDESSTRTATVDNTIQPGGVIGPPYWGPRVLTVRMMAIAGDECSLRAGLDWLRAQTQVTTDLCTGDSLTFFDCCPCICENADDPNPDNCWPLTYAELDAGPSCDPDFWPTTYAELITGPPPDDEQWCAWADTYFELDHGPPLWSCCVDQCVVPYLRYYNKVRITEGPIMLRSPDMSTGAMAELQMTIVAADPTEYGAQTRRTVARTTELASAPVPAPPPTPTPMANPWNAYALPAVLATSQAVLHPPTTTAWTRTESLMLPAIYGHVLSSLVPSVQVRTFSAPAGEVRIGLWLGGQLIRGWLIEMIPASAIVHISAGQSLYALVNGQRFNLAGAVRNWDGGLVKWGRLPHGEYLLTIDQEAGAEVDLLVEAFSTPAAA